MKSIFLKLFLGNLVIVALFAASILYFSYDEVERDYIKKKLSELQKLNKITESYLSKDRFNNIQGNIKKLAEISNFRLTVVDGKGNVHADSEGDPRKMENHSDRPEIYYAFSKGSGYSIRHSRTIDRDMLYVATPVYDKGKVTYVIRSSVNLKEIDVLLENLQSQIIYILLAISAISILFSIFYSRAFTKPVKELIRVSNEISAGNFDVKADIRSNDELGRLGASVNTTIQQLKGLFARINRKKDELNNIISSINEGLAVFSKEGKLILSNSKFRSIVKALEGANLQYFEILRNDKLIKCIKKLIDKNREFNIEAELGGEHYICGGNIINEKGDIALILHNISEIKKLEDIKKDFAVNVSHELRTPLTVIKGYLETVSEGQNAENERYLDIIKKHTDRLINIVNDLLLISEMESKKDKMELENVDIEKVLADIHESFKQKLQEKDLEFIIENKAGNLVIKADRFKIEQLLINLIDNAIKYTDSGRITVALYHDINNFILEVKDTGIGIPEKDTQRIFERFYTVDKSHSRQKGGTGLGLSIVKHIALAHGGAVTVKSRVGEGTIFTVSLPQRAEKEVNNQV